MEEVGGQRCFNSELSGMFRYFGNVLKFKCMDYLLVIGLHIRVLYIVGFSIADEMCFTLHESGPHQEPETTVFRTGKVLVRRTVF